MLFTYIYLYTQSCIPTCWEVLVFSVCVQENVLYDLIGRQDKGLALAYQVSLKKIGAYWLACKHSCKYVHVFMHVQNVSMLSTSGSASVSFLSFSLFLCFIRDYDPFVRTALQGRRRSRGTPWAPQGKKRRFDSALRRLLEFALHFFLRRFYQSFRDDFRKCVLIS